MIRKIEKIKSKNIRIDELESYIGQMAEIIVIPCNEKISQFNLKEINKLAGVLKSGPDPVEYQKEQREEWRI